MLSLIGLPNRSVRLSSKSSATGQEEGVGLWVLNRADIGPHPLKRPPETGSYNRLFCFGLWNRPKTSVEQDSWQTAGQAGHLQNSSQTQMLTKLHPTIKTLSTERILTSNTDQVQLCQHACSQAVVNRNILITSTHTPMGPQAVATNHATETHTNWFATHPSPSPTPGKGSPPIWPRCQTISTCSVAPTLDCCPVAPQL